jgi:deoxyribodipyrimidine photolyase-related protein
MEATIIYPHQLFKDLPAVADGRLVYLVEEPLLLTHNPIHRQKLMLHKLSMDAFERELASAGITVTRLTIADHPKTAAVFTKLKQDGVTKLHIVDTTDCYLERAIAACGIERVWYDSPQFILPKSDACARFATSKKFMASFYKQLRKDKNILINSDGEPTGGKWSFDEENRKKIPKGTELPEDLRKFGNAETGAAENWTEAVEAEKYGAAGCWLPYTHTGAEEFLQEFFCTRFAHFGPYEDALTTRGTRLWHSTISPLLNIGLLTPQYVLDKAISYANEHNVPMNSLEGFVRQILGWREFIRASYEVDGNKMRQQNFFKHTRSLPAAYWDGTTGLAPVDHAINNALQYGYNHHIERLMVMGNVMLLSQINPHDVYRWFMGMYIDAYDWVMVPNVYGMSQFADGGSFATKPYISGANYIKKMSDYKTGDWEQTWTALYWNFINTHLDVFKSNHRMSMMPRLLEKMDPDTREQHFETAKLYFQK